MTEHTVLFVDDEKNILKALQRLFLDEEYAILTAESGKEALSLLDSGETPTVIVSDQRMPEMDGAEFLALAKERLPESIRMVLTGYADINAAVDAVNRGGIYRYIMKPWNDDDLKLTVKDAIDRFELVQKNRELTAELVEKNKALEELNATLEEKVKERTHDLQEALNKNRQLNVVLKEKVRELQGRDRIQQHLLTIHPLEETLQLVLEVITEVVKVDAAAVYLADKSEKGARIAAATSEMAEGTTLFDFSEDNDEGEVFNRSLHTVLSSGKPLTLEREDVWVGETVKEKILFFFVPLRKGDDSLGAIVIAWASEKPFKKSDAQTINSFGMLAAIAVSDSLLKQDLPSLEGVLDDVLMDFSDEG